MTRYFLGLDAGTSVCKAALFDTKGQQVAVATRRSAVLRPNPGWSELDPTTALENAYCVIRQVVADSGVDPRQIAGLGLSAAMVGVWLVDEAHNALRPGILWEDSRAASLIEAMQAQDKGVLSRIFASSGSVLQQGCTLPLLAWLARHEPQILRQARFALSYKDFLRLHLTGIAATDRSEAAVVPGSARLRNRSDEMIRLFGLEEWQHLLPPVYESTHFIGGLTQQAAQHLALPVNLPVAIGAGDVAATLIGAGCMTKGATLAVLGTTAMVGVCCDRPVFEPSDLGLLFSLPDDHWYRAMVNVAGTLNLDWACNTLAPDLADDPHRYDKMSALVATSPVGANHLTYLPYLSESGIIAPRVDDKARAQFCGLAPRHNRADIFRAVFEGVAFSLKDLLELLAKQANTDLPIVLAGGGGRSAFWAQMIADCLCKPIIVPEAIEFGARGAAMLAATAAGKFASIAQASQMLAAARQGITYQPNLQLQTEYARAYQLYQHYRDRLLN